MTEPTLRLLTFSTLTPEEMMAVSEYEGDERVRLAHARGKSILFFTGHFGFWELHALAHAVKLRPIGVLARALDNARLNDLLEQVRTQTGNHVIYRQGAVRRVMKTLAAGDGVTAPLEQAEPEETAIPSRSRVGSRVSLLAPGMEMLVMVGPPASARSI